MLALGLSDEDLDSIEIWPENWAAFTLFVNLQTQWRMGPRGATGLDYQVMLALIARLDLSKAEEEQIFRDMRTMEIAALDVIHQET
jgi:hypothetical protein